MSPVTGYRWVLVVVVLGLAGALVGAVPSEVSAVAGRSRCRPTAFVTSIFTGTVSTIDLKTRTAYPAGVFEAPSGGVFPTGDITVGSNPVGVAVTHDGKTLFVTNRDSSSVSTIDVKTRTKHPTDIAVGPFAAELAVTPCRR